MTNVAKATLIAFTNNYNAAEVAAKMVAAFGPDAANVAREAAANAIKGRYDTAANLWLTVAAEIN